MNKLRKDDIVYPELSYKIVGVLYDVFNELGAGYQEKYYQRALEIAFKKSGINFVPQSPYKIQYKSESIGRYFMDFVIEEKVILEIKKGDYYSRSNISQINAYLKALDYKLGILANFTSNGVKYKRILNIN